MTVSYDSKYRSEMAITLKASRALRQKLIRIAAVCCGAGNHPKSLESIATDNQ